MKVELAASRFSPLGESEGEGAVSRSQNLEVKTHTWQMLIFILLTRSLSLFAASLFGMEGK